uniref:Uncharacterized protein n=1 Tax=Arundo donax TaxID=35708 RepID=A0A0A9BQW8_ARUDO
MNSARRPCSPGSPWTSAPP